MSFDVAHPQGDENLFFVKFARYRVTVAANLLQLAVGTKEPRKF